MAHHEVQKKAHSFESATVGIYHIVMRLQFSPWLTMILSGYDLVRYSLDGEFSDLTVYGGQSR